MTVAAVAQLCYRWFMVREIKLRQVGGSLGATLPKDMADRLHLAVGDSVLAIETDQGILLTPYDPTVEEALAIAARAAKRYRHALRELAK
jgi:antitoxin MazE